MPRDLSSEVYILADTKFVAVQHCSEFRFADETNDRCRGHRHSTSRELFYVGP